MHQLSIAAGNESAHDSSTSGKTSSAMPCRFSRGQLVEVNAHSLFSKWFSESGKLVSRLFARIQVSPATTAAASPSKDAAPSLM